MDRIDDLRERVGPSLVVCGYRSGGDDGEAGLISCLAQPLLTCTCVERVDANKGEVIGCETYNSISNGEGVVTSHDRPLAAAALSLVKISLLRLIA